ncbi:MAG: gamma-glutamyltransferase [Clostridia bacterium]|nr:gamma-glutamyltransferase [Clostridia bacterium]
MKKTVLKRIAALVLAVLIMATFAACNGDGDDSKKSDSGLVDVVPENTPYDDSDLSLTTAATHTYAVSTSNRLATQVGMEVLEKGGNAVDAAVAVAYTLTVVQPYASGLGGGGCLLLYDPATDEYAFYDYFAAMRSTDTFSENNIGVPGFVKGMDAVLNDYGTMDYASLLSYATDYAENGCPVTADIETRINVAYADLKYYRMFYDEDGNLLELGDTLYMEDMANTLKTLAKDGPDDFYTGKTAEAIVNASGSSLTMEDLAAFSVAKETPVMGEFMGYEVAAAPAPFSGTTVIQMLKMAEKLDMANPADDSLQYLEDLTVISTLAYNDRAAHIADPDFVKVNEEKLVSDDYIAKLLKKAGVEAKDDPEHVSTTHFSIIDENGMVVSSTNTLSSFWGSRVCVNGIFLNDTMAHFGTADSVNCVEAGKTPRSYSCPLIIKGADNYILAMGTPGGNNIPKILAPVIIDYLKFETDLQDAIFKGRIYSKSADTLIVEEREFFPLIADVESAPYYMVNRDDAAYFGNIAAVGFSPEKGRVFSVYDDRRGGTSISANEN